MHKNVAYDQFYCEHIYVFSAIALKKILDKFDFEIFDIQNTKTHGGSNRYFIKRKKNSFYKLNPNVLKNIVVEKKMVFTSFQHTKGLQIKFYFQKNV